MSENINLDGNNGDLVVEMDRRDYPSLGLSFY